MDPERARAYYQQIKSLIDAGRFTGSEEVDLYVRDNIPGFDSYGDLVYLAQNGVRREADPDQSRARVAEMSPVGRFARGAVQGATFGFADEALGMVNPEMGERWSQDINTLRDEYPGAMMAAEMAGGVALPGFGAGKGAGWLMGRGFGPAAARLAAGAAAGAGSGALTGVGEGEGALGRTIGGVAGGVAGGLLGTVLGAASGVGGRLTGRFFPRAVEATGGIEGSAGRMFRRGLSEAGVSPDNLRAPVEAIGEQAVPADLSPTLGRQLFAARSLAPEMDLPGGPMQTLVERNAGRGARIADDLDAAATRSGAFPYTQSRALDVSDLLKQRAQEAYYRPLDESFGNMSPDQIPNVIEWMERGGPRMTELFDDVTAGPMRFMQFQDFRNALRDEADVLRIEGRRTKADALDAQVESLTAAMTQDFGDDVVRADALWSQALRTSKLYDEGMKLGSKSGLDMEIALRRMDWDNMDPDARASLLAGAVDKIRSKLTQRETGGGTATGLMRMGEDTERQLRALVRDDEEAFQMLRDALNRELQYESTLYWAGGNSLTSMREADKAAMRSDISAVPLTVLEGIRKFAHWAARNPDVDRRTALQLGKALVGDEEVIQNILARSQGSRWSQGTATLQGAISAIAGRQSSLALQEGAVPEPPPGPPGFFDGGVR